MRYLIASDLHGSITFCEKLFEAYKKEKADRLVLLGDVLYHGPRNALPNVYDTKAVASMLNEHKNEIYAVRGNCDAEVDQMMLDFPIMADYMIIDNGHYHIFATHGHLYNNENLPPLKDGDILLHGHTHFYADEQMTSKVSAFAPEEVGIKYRYCNPGSISIPKDGKRGYFILDGEEFTWKEL